jgi:hypothetical protein
MAAPPPPEYEGRRDPNNPGGERLGEEEDFTGYPADPGEPGDPYYDPSSEYRAYSPNYTGQTFGLGIQGGVGWLYGPNFNEATVGPAFGGYLEATTLLGVVSFYGTLTRSQFSNAPIGDDRVDVVKHELHVSTALHPLLFFILGGTRLDYTIQNFYLMAGGNLTFFDADGDSVNSNFTRPGFHLGAGIDTYLDDVNDGGAFWIGVQYRWTNTGGGRNDDLFRDNWIREHQLFLRLSYRWNGFIGHGASGPTAP